MSQIIEASLPRTLSDPGPVQTAAPSEWALLGAPIDCSGNLRGTNLLPEALRLAGIVEALGIPNLGDLELKFDQSSRDALTGMIAPSQVREVSEEIYREILKLLEAGRRPFVLGGCCTVLIGICAALKKYYGEFGLLFVDGHLDYYDGRSSLHGEAADMELRFVLGRGPSEITNLADVSAPFAQSSNVIVCGFRDEENALRDGAPDIRQEEPQVVLLGLSKLREFGIGPASRYISERLARLEKPFWLHLDVDVLSDLDMPAVDYLQSDGLSWAELIELLKPASNSKALIGVDVTILNPSLDKDGSSVKLLVSALEDVFAHPLAYNTPNRSMPEGKPKHDTLSKEFIKSS
ncbi:MAG: hypothetical protein DCC75_03520 [Proteobacteria bacterium]|nr:MAG: hypothetical protein DCC75_03520 [Pseudomonadota bacterium]